LTKDSLPEEDQAWTCPSCEQNQITEELAQIDRDTCNSIKEQLDTLVDDCEEIV
jgi:hypothetical protein